MKNKQKKTIVINLFLYVIRMILLNSLEITCVYSLISSLKITNENMLIILTKIFNEIIKRILMKLINETIDYSIKHTSNIHQTYIKITSNIQS